MAQNFPVPPQTLQNGDTIFGPVAVPVGTHQAILTLDVAQMIPGQRVDIFVEYWDGIRWTGFKADFRDGPWRDRQQVVHTDVALKFDLGSYSLDGATWIARVSAAGWQMRTTFTVFNGPFTTAGGTLALS